MREKRQTGPQAAVHAWRVPVAQAEVPETGLHFDLVADARVRAGLAELAGLSSLPRLTATFNVKRHGRSGLHVLGHVSATVGQICGVTLEPIENKVDEAIDLLFEPAAADRGKSGTAFKAPRAHDKARPFEALAALKGKGREGEDR